jgi:hypothetical protein
MLLCVLAKILGQRVSLSIKFSILNENFDSSEKNPQNPFNKLLALIKHNKRGGDVEIKS